MIASTRPSASANQPSKPRSNSWSPRVSNRARSPKTSRGPKVRHKNHVINPVNFSPNTSATPSVSTPLNPVLERRGVEMLLSAHERQQGAAHLLVRFDVGQFETTDHVVPEPERVRQAECGTIDKYVGDAVMAFWNAPRPLEGHPKYACAAVLDCKAALARLYASPGMAWVAAAGHSFRGAHRPRDDRHFGAPTRFSYTALGGRRESRCPARATLQTVRRRGFGEFWGARSVCAVLPVSSHRPRRGQRKDATGRRVRTPWTSVPGRGAVGHSLRTRPRGLLRAGLRTRCSVAREPAARRSERTSLRTL